MTVRPADLACDLMRNDGMTVSTFIVSGGVGPRDSEIFLTAFEPHTVGDFAVDGVPQAGQSVPVPFNAFGTHELRITFTLTSPSGTLALGIHIHITEEAETLNTVRMTIESATHTP